MAATFDANALADTTSNGVLNISASNLTIGSGSNRALTVPVSFSLRTVSAVTVTWDNGASNQACTQILGANGSAGTVGRAELWGLVNPISGAKTLRAAWTGASDVCINGASWTSVDQTGGVTTFPHSTSATGSTAAPSVTITSAVGNATVNATTSDFGTYSAPTQTQLYIDNAPANICAAASRAAGAATVTHAWTLSAGSNWVSVGTDILAAAAGAAFIAARNKPILQAVHRAGTF